MKYIVTQEEGHAPEIFIFPKRFNHDDMADMVCNLKTYDPNNRRNWERNYKEPIAAGFTDGKHCHGRSETLNLDSRGRLDELLIE